MRVIRQIRNEPDPGGVAEGFSRIGYRIEEALADVIDNSIDARAKHVLIVFERDEERVQQIDIIDDGDGVDEKDLERAMQFGGRTGRSTDDLGRYGWGFKTASLSQGQRLILLTRTLKHTAGRQWSRASINAGWLCDELDVEDVSDEFGRDWPGIEPRRHGTIVQWTDLDHLTLHSGSLDRALSLMSQQIGAHLGMVFHRFLSGTASHGRRIEINFATRDTVTGAFGVVRPVGALDPFGYSKSGAPGFPMDFLVHLPETRPLVLAAHIWPAKSKDPGYRLGGRIAERQGFYFYRNDRLIQAGGWNGWRQANAEPHLSLARVAVELSPDFDNLFRVQVQKSGLDVPPSFLAARGEVRSKGGLTFEHYIQVADRVYRSGSTKVPEKVLSLGAGFPKQMQERTEPGSKRGRAVDFVWEELPEDQLFDLDRDSSRVILNSMYRAQLNAGHKGSKTDVPLFKAMLFRLLEADLAAERSSQRRREEVDGLNELLLLALTYERSS